MTEPPLPPKVPSAPFAAAPEGLTSAIGRSRQIQRRRALVTGSAGTTFALLLLAVLIAPGSGHGPQDRLVIASATPTAGTSAPSGAPLPQTKGSSSPSASPASSPSPSGRGTAPGTPEPTVQPSPTTAPVLGSEVGPPHEETAYDATRGCNGTGPTATNGWCSYYDGDTTAKSGTSATIATAVCRLPGQPTATLTFANGQQADFDLGPKTYPAVWTWSKGRRFAASSPPITLAAGRCVRWFVTWGVQDDHGTPLPPGSYYLDASPMEDRQPGAYVDTVNPVTFTVTS
jgi:hypothetical protein